SDMSDLNFEGFTLNGQQTGMQYDYLLENNVVRDVTCQKGTPATWDYETNSININPKGVIYGDYCTINFKDAFAVNNSKAKLTYPIGLMTADEIVYAGGTYGTTTSNAWFYRNNKSVSSDYSHSITALNNWWTMTPAVWAMNGIKNASMFNAYTVRGLLATTNSNNTSGMVVRPVISLSGSLKVASGNGSSSNPYMLSLQTVRVNFHRNRTSSDTSVASQYFILGESGNRFGYFTDGTPRWKQTGQFGQYDYAGHTLQGWALIQNATAKNYSVYSGVKDSWLTNVVNKKFDGQTTAGVIDLYAVWSKN
ncbi:MAG: hypothetical protein MR779_00105, partial [Tenericutes bacterium]|nr:hypothetical protein [Mycoplasmatota bacterium]